MTLLQLDPPLPLLTPKGEALAHFLIDYGAEHDLLWVCFQNATGECWTWGNPQVRATKNVTMGRDKEPTVGPVRTGVGAVVSAFLLLRDSLRQIGINTEKVEFIFLDEDFAHLSRELGGLLTPTVGVPTVGLFGFKVWKKHPS